MTTPWPSSSDAQRTQTAHPSWHPPRRSPHTHTHTHNTVLWLVLPPVHGLCTGPVGGLRHSASNGWVNNELKSICKEEISWWRKLWQVYYPATCLWGLRKITKNLSTDLNPHPTNIRKTVDPVPRRQVCDRRGVSVFPPDLIGHTPRKPISDLLLSARNVGCAKCHPHSTLSQYTRIYTQSCFRKTVWPRKVSQNWRVTTFTVHKCTEVLLLVTRHQETRFGRVVSTWQ
jgi:hypothetical protein